MMEISPYQLSPTAIKQDTTEYYTLHKQARRAGFKRTTRGLGNTLICQCRPRTQTNTIWNIIGHAQRKQVQSHDPDCPFAIYENLYTTLHFRISLCSMLLKKKFQIAVEFYYGNGEFGIRPTLQTRRIVKESMSPAFNLMEAYFQDYYDESRKQRKPGLKHLWSRLLQLFQDREASPYDQLPDGTTLLHRLCDLHYRILSSLDDSITLLARMMGPTIYETDSQNKTCLDILICDLLLGGDCIEKSVTYLLDCEVGFGMFRYPIYTSLTNNLAPIWTQKNVDWEVCWKGSDATRAILMKSGSLLENIVRSDPAAIQRDSIGYNALELATVTGWLEGCEILWKHNRLPISYNACQKDSLLEHAVKSQDEETVRFWLDVRRTGNPAIGCIVDAIGLGVTHPNSIMDLLISELIQQRIYLKSLALSHLPSEVYFITDDRLLDAHAYYVFKALVERGIIDSPILLPPVYTVYHSVRVARIFNIETAEKLYQAGFCDVDSQDHNATTLSPLLYNAMGLHVDWCEWLISKGAVATEKWPGEEFTAAQLLAHGTGRNYQKYGWSIHCFKKWQQQQQFFLRLCELECHDGCICGCSHSGCNFVSALLRGATEVPNETDMCCPIFLYIFTSWVAPAARKSRRVTSQLIRALTFWQLGIRHTCCNFGHLFDIIEAEGAEGAEYFKLPTIHEIRYEPRRHLDDLNEIMEEDTPLLEQLEQLIYIFETEYDRRGDDIVDFIMGYWSAKMLEELYKLEKEDSAIYDKGRALLGVEMKGHVAQSFTECTEGLAPEPVETERDFPKNLSIYEEFTRYPQPGLGGWINGDLVLDWYSGLRIKDVIPTVHTVDELDDEFSNAQK